MRNITNAVTRSLLMGLVCFMLITVAAGRAQAATEAENQVFDYITANMGMSPAAACGVMANIREESRFLPALSGGVCQWGGVRLSRLYSYCASKGLSSSSLSGQLAFMNHELQNTFPSVYSYLKSVPNTAQGAYDAAHYFCVYYEAPANKQAKGAHRGGVARDTYWPEYAKRSVFANASSTAKGVKLTWNSKKEKIYLIKRAAKINGNYKTIAATDRGASTYTDTTAKKGKKYYYQVVVKGSSGVESNKVMITPQCTLRDAGVKIKLSEEWMVYNGKQRKPAVKIYYAGKRLKEGRDYTLKYKNNIKKGKASIIITGKNNYQGTVKKTFRIVSKAKAAKLRQQAQQSETETEVNAGTAAEAVTAE